MLAIIELIILAIFSYTLWCVFRPSIKVKEKKEVGVKGAKSIYKDEKGAKLLVADKLAIQGKPDFIFETWFRKKCIPLEIKSGSLKDDTPHLGDLYQLGAYFLIIEEVYGKKPPYGKLVYSNKTFTVRNTRSLRRNILRTVHDMRDMLEQNHTPKPTPDFVKCRHCICKDTVCEWQNSKE